MNRTDLQTYDTEESYPLLMRTCTKLLRDNLNRSFTNSGFTITGEQWVLLVHLTEKDGVPQQALADRSARSKVAVFKLIEKLEKQDLIRRETDPEDGRCKLVFLTDKGRELQSELIPLANANANRMSSGITEEEMEQLKGILRKIISNAME